jgi:hypothetical protein
MVTEPRRKSNTNLIRFGADWAEPDRGGRMKEGIAVLMKMKLNFNFKIYRSRSNFASDVDHSCS